MRNERLNMWLPDIMKSAAEDVAGRNGISTSEIVRMGLELLLLKDGNNKYAEMMADRYSDIVGSNHH